MAWEDRNGSRYYYRKRREGKQVVSEYVGGGLAGRLAEILEGEDRQETEYKRHELRKRKRQSVEIDAQVSEVQKYTRTITRAYLLLAGYHAHKRQWRKSRNGR
jgi:hypothetical protein